MATPSAPKDEFPPFPTLDVSRTPPPTGPAQAEGEVELHSEMPPAPTTMAYEPAARETFISWITPPPPPPPPPYVPPAPPPATTRMSAVPWLLAVNVPEALKVVTVGGLGMSAAAPQSGDGGGGDNGNESTEVTATVKLPVLSQHQLWPDVGLGES